MCPDLDSMFGDNDNQRPRYDMLTRVQAYVCILRDSIASRSIGICTRENLAYHLLNVIMMKAAQPAEPTAEELLDESVPWAPARSLEYMVKTFAQASKDGKSVINPIFIFRRWNVYLAV
jgi:hypothetical protein